MKRLKLLIAVVSIMVYDAYAFQPYSSNSSFVIEIENYVENYQNTHPKVLYFENGWNYYEFWMVYTPYPFSRSEYENPCIAVSHDGLQWETPPGLCNPLENTPEEGYNSDPHLVYDKENNILECWWRVYSKDTMKDALCRRTTKDGINWSETEIIVEYGNPREGRLSPVVWIEDGIYKVVYSDGRTLKYIYGTDDSGEWNWSKPKSLSVDWSESYCWHHDMIIDDEGYWEFVISGYPVDGTNYNNELYYLKLNPDNTDSAKPVLLLSRGTGENDFDNRSLYRSSLVKVGEEYYLYYCGISLDGYWSVSLLKGPSIDGLKQLENTDIVIILKGMEGVSVKEGHVRINLVSASYPENNYIADFITDEEVVLPEVRIGKYFLTVTLSYDGEETIEYNDLLFHSRQEVIEVGINNRSFENTPLINFEKPVMPYYNILGNPIKDGTLAPGIYIRPGYGKTEKVLIK